MPDLHQKKFKMKTIKELGEFLRSKFVVGTRTMVIFHDLGVIQAAAFHLHVPYVDSKTSLSEVEKVAHVFQNTLPEHSAPLLVLSECFRQLFIAPVLSKARDAAQIVVQFEIDPL